MDLPSLTVVEVWQMGGFGLYLAVPRGYSQILWLEVLA